MKTPPRILRYLTRRMTEIIVRDMVEECEMVIELWIRDRVRRIYV